MFKYGTTRKTLLIGKYAIKFPTASIDRKKFLRGMLSNCIEADMSRCTTAKVTKIYWCGLFGLIQISERLEPVSNLLEFIEDLDDLCAREPNREEFYSYDSHADNFGYNQKGELIKQDYASPFMKDLYDTPE